MRKWARQILSGLDYLHLKDPPVIHGDLRCDKVCPTRSQDTVDPSASAAGLECVGQVCRAWKALCDLKRGRGCLAHPLLTGPRCCADLHQWSQRRDQNWRLGPCIPSAQAISRRHDPKSSLHLSTCCYRMPASQCVVVLRIQGRLATLSVSLRL